MLESHHFRLPVCRFVIDLFDKRVLRQIVLEEDDDEGGDNDDSDSDAEYLVMNGDDLRSL